MNLREFAMSKPPPNKNEIDLGRLRLVDVMTTGEGNNTLLGPTKIFGVWHHVAFVRVHEVDGEQVAVCDPLGVLDNIRVAAVALEGALQTVEVPTLEGEWVICITPFEVNETQ